MSEVDSYLADKHAEFIAIGERDKADKIAAMIRDRFENPRLPAGTEMVVGTPRSWMDAPKPSRWHRCTAATAGYVNYFSYVERCACGAIRSRQSGRWYDRNSR